MTAATPKTHRCNWITRWVLGTAAAALLSIWILTCFADAEWGIPGAFHTFTRWGEVVVLTDPPSAHGTRVLAAIGVAPNFRVNWNGFRPVADRAWNPFLWLRWLPEFSTDRYWFDNTPYYRVHLPLWIPFTLCGIPSFLAWHRERKWRAAVRDGACQQCGYTLKGLTPGAPCPECGESRNPGS